MNISEKLKKLNEELYLKIKEFSEKENIKVKQITIDPDTSTVTTYKEINNSLGYICAEYEFLNTEIVIKSHIQ